MDSEASKMSLKSGLVRADVVHLPVSDHELPSCVIYFIRGKLLPFAELSYSHLLVGFELSDDLRDRHT